LELELGDHGDDGNPTAEMDGAPVRVMGGLAGERVRCEVVWIDPDLIHVRVREVIEPSDHRVDAPCGYFLDCTGCQWQHVSYEHQLVLKRERVVMAMSQYPALSGFDVAAVAGSKDQLGYRNHARFTVARWPENRGEVGFMGAASRRFVRIDECLLMNEPVNAVLSDVQGKLSGMSQFSVRANGSTGSMLIQPPLPEGVSQLASGQARYEEIAAGISFKVASPSFFQVNTGQLERMVELVRAMLELDGSGTLLDAYSGVGTFSVLLAPHVERVIAIEESASGIVDARENAAGISNIEFMQGRSEELMPGLAGNIDYVILDPPRAGCMPEALESVAKMRPTKVVLVSCDTSAMARDQVRMVGDGFRLGSVQPVDMFPQTRHVEVLSLFEGPPESTV
jgi:23S rRNA (uracil1939-C5)-methyltransferase